jgi:hypothetical protein
MSATIPSGLGYVAVDHVAGKFIQQRLHRNSIPCDEIGNFRLVDIYFRRVALAIQ